MHKQHTPRLALLAALLWIAAWATGCSEQPASQSQPACQVNAECAAGQICQDGACATCQGQEGCACAASEDCGAGLSCQASTCQPEEVCEQGSVGCACYGNGTCDGELSCGDQGLCQEPEVVCEQGTFNCPCYGNNTCNGGLACHQEERCIPEGCQDGAQGCPCGQENTCDAGLICGEDRLCAPRVCEEAQAGSEGCDCRTEPGQEPCGEDLYCGEGQLCAACLPGLGPGCACLEDNTCQGDLVCDQEAASCRDPLLCEDLGCAEHQLCQEAGEGQDAQCLPMCDNGLVWDALSGACEPAPEANCQDGAPGSLLEACAQVHRQCVTAGDSADCGACLGGYVEEDGLCRAALRCADLGCQAQHRDCQDNGEEADAACGACEAGYQEADGACEPTPDNNCLEGSDPNSILADCTGQNRSCQDMDGGAQCGGCLEGYGQDPDSMECIQRLCEDLDCQAQGRECGGEPLAACGDCLEGLLPSQSDACVEPRGCDEVACGDDQFCVETGREDAFCADWPCVGEDNLPNLGAALRQDSQQCVTCEVSCDGEGLTGQLWPYTQEGSHDCLCQTRQGYYLDPAQPSQAVACDADQDGWLRLGARDALDSAQEGIAQNARCDLRQIKRVVLRNELGQELPLALCQSGPVQQVACDPDGEDSCGEGVCDADSGTCGCAQEVALPLYESDRNDDQSALGASGLPSLSNQGQGRALVASELNSLTRACASEQADHNDNGVADLEEDQHQSFTGADPALAAFGPFAYFVELHQGSFRASEQGGEPGDWVIAERSRCQEGFPLAYDTALDAGDYWRGCTRQRDAGYDAEGGSRVGYDFAAWSCDATSGTCPVDPVTDQSAEAFVAPHGLCDEGLTLPPSDGVWRGMNHHSQFKCVVLADSVEGNRDSQSPWVRALEEATDQQGQGAYQMQACAVACPEGDSDCAQDCDDQGRCQASATGESGDAGQVEISCQAVPRDQLAAGAVGWAALRYQGGADYQRGCLDEGQRWPQLCPGYSDSLDSVLAVGDGEGFGALICGCGLNFGGEGCERSCADQDLMVGGAGDGEDCVDGYCLRSGADGDKLLRSGWWTCARPSLVITEDGDGNLDNALRSARWTERGSVEHGGVYRQWKCENEDCDSGWSIR